MSDRVKLETLFNRCGFTDFKWIDPLDIIIGQWVRMKCMFGCGDYGQNVSCPPNVPSVSECRQFFNEYKTAAIFHFAKKVDKPEDRFAWTREINQKLIELEKETFLFGCQKAFVLVIDSCTLCEKCTGFREKCINPRLVRPTPEAMAIDVFSTVKKQGYPIQVLTDYSHTMNRYAFLLIE